MDVNEPDDADADALRRRSEGWTVEHGLVEGRLPMVLCEPDLAGLKHVGRRLDCALPDVLFAVYGLALKGDAEGIRQSQPTDLGAMLAPVHKGDGTAPFGYAIWRKDGDAQEGLDDPDTGERDLRIDADSGAGHPAEGMGSLRLPDVRSAAFFYQHRSPGSDALAERRAMDRGTYARYDLVTEVSEFEHHVLFECFFSQRTIPTPYVALLLHRYLSGLKGVGALPRDLITRAAAVRRRTGPG